MQSITLQSRAGQDGMLQIQVPVGKPNTEWEVVVVISPIPKYKTNGDSNFESLVDYGSEQIKKVCAERGIDWDALDEESRTKLIDQILHEA